MNCIVAKKIITRHIYEATQDIKVEIIKQTKYFFARTQRGILKSKNGVANRPRTDINVTKINLRAEEQKKILI